MSPEPRWTDGRVQEPFATSPSGAAIAPDGGGLRKDDGKNKLDLIPPEWIWGLGCVLTQGAEKYARRNWERGMLWSKMVGCGLRHIMKFVCGERYDRGSGCHHLLHAAWNILALFTYDVRGIGENDLPNQTDAFRFMSYCMDPEHPRTQHLMALEATQIKDDLAPYSSQE